MRKNPYIRSGYRPHLTPQLCIKSAFWWTNETLNIWTHISGCAFFILLLLYDAIFILKHLDVTFADFVILAITVVSFQFCLTCSAAYHTFCCTSESAYERWLFWDILGVSLSMTFIFISGIHFAFRCFPGWHTFYIATVTALFVVAVGMLIHPKYKSDKYFYIRLTLFTIWGSYGVVPTLHWIYLSEGLSNFLVQVLVPRVGGMYLIAGLAFFIYLNKYPEKWWPGRVDYIGSSHQWWHILVVIAFYWWHNTGLLYTQYRKYDQCSV